MTDSDCFGPPLGRLRVPAWTKPASSGGRSLLDRLLKQGPLPQASLPKLLDLAQPTVARLVGTFSNDGLVRVSARSAGRPGNPSVTLSLEPDFAYGLGIALVGDAVSMAIVDFAGSVRALRSLAMTSMQPNIVAAELGRLKAELVRDTNIDPTRFVGAGVGFSGFFVGEPPRFNPPPLLVDWLGIDIVELLEPILQMSVLCDNDGTTAAVAESLLGIGRTCSTFAYCHLTNGFGGGLIVDGRVMRGAQGNAGDFGGVWWLLNEGYPNLERLRARLLEFGGSYASVEDMVRIIDKDTPGVDAWIDDAVGPFGKLAFLLGHMIAPEKVVIGGRLPHWLAERLAARIDLPRSPVRNEMPFPLPEVVASEIQENAVAIGAAIMPLQSVFFA